VLLTLSKITYWDAKRKDRNQTAGGGGSKWKIYERLCNKISKALATCTSFK